MGYRYMQIHPLAYIVKLKIEMSMADLITKVATGTGVQESLFIDNSLKTTHSHTQPEHRMTYFPTQTSKYSHPTDSELNQAFGTSTDVELNWVTKPDTALDRVHGRSPSNSKGDMTMNMRRDVHIQVERRNSLAPSFKFSRTDSFEGSATPTYVEDELKLLRKAYEENREARLNAERAFSNGTSQQMGVYTEVWAPR
jgi:hypothetical protein